MFAQDRFEKRDAYDYHNTQIKCPWQVPFLRKTFDYQNPGEKNKFFFSFLSGGGGNHTQIYSECSSSTRLVPEDFHVEKDCR